MASSEVEICNSALVKVGADRIISLSDDNERAQICNERYPKLRDDMLRSHPWNFALARVALADTGNTPEYDYTNEFQIPSDVLRIIGTDLYSDEIYKIEGKTLLANSSSVKIQYIKKITDVSYFDSNFAEALSFRLAADIAYRISNSVNLTNQMYQLYLTVLRDARSMDAQEGVPDRIVADEWINSRF